jgi:hypothetical protein
MYKIKVSIRGVGEDPDISQFSGNSKNRIGDCEFFVNSSSKVEFDFWFVIEDLAKENEMAYLPADRVCYLSAEPTHSKGYYDDFRLVKFLDQFSNIVTCHDIFRNNVKFDIPFLPWMINSNHGPSIFSSSERDLNWLDQNNEINKSKSISVFCSTQQKTEDHRLRLKFVTALKAHFGDQLDWFGNGINPLERKWEGIADYKYHIALENQSRNNVITEKLYDSFLGLSYPIYYGAPNVYQYFDRRSLSTIDIMDINSSIKTIEDILETDPFSAKLPYIIESKTKTLLEYNLFTRMATIAVNQIEQTGKSRMGPVTLKNITYFNKMIEAKHLGKAFAYRASRLTQIVTDRLLEISQ